MLTHINIQGLAIIESLAIEFSSSFNVITGETGAGKSILIKALGLLLGAKASPDVVRRGFDQAVVCGAFRVPSAHRAVAVMRDIGIAVEVELGEVAILIRRQVTAKGRSQAWVNDVPVTLGSLRELGYFLIDIFGQHENQRLLDSSQHLYYVDKFLPNRACRDNVVAKYREVAALLSEIEELIETFRSRVKDRDYLTFRCEELNKFGPAKEDYDEVFDLSDRASSALSIRESLLRVQGLIDQGVDGEPISRALWEAARILESLGKADSAFSSLSQDISDVAAKVDDISFALDRSAANVDIDENDLEAAQERLAGYQSFFRKLAVGDIDGLLAEIERLQGELTFLDSATAELKTRLVKLSKLTIELRKAADLLTKERKKAATGVKKKIESELRDLEMSGSVLEVAFQPTARNLSAIDLSGLEQELHELWAESAEILSEVGEYGAERAQFLLSANPGEPALPLQKIASGGEISRIMLALKKALAAGAETCVLVFDEIDTGISGRAADVVGKKMKELAANFQVICISHLAQVAAYANTHFRVEKQRRNSRTESHIIRLSVEESAEEIARLLSGPEITSPSLENAKSLVQRARQC